MNERPIPSNIETERATLAAILSDRLAIVTLAERLKPEHFYHEQHRWIYEAAVTVYRRGTPPDLQTVLEELRKHDRDKTVGGLAGLVDLQGFMPTAYHVEYYAEPIIETATRRALLQAVQRIATLAYDEDRPLGDIVGDCHAELARAVQQTGGGEAASAAQVVDELMIDWESDDTPGVMTGLLDFDAKLGGIQPEDLLILAARPSVGKSSLAAQIAVNIAKRGEQVFFFSHEMGRKKIMQRFVCQQIRYDLQRMTLKKWNQEELNRLVECAGKTSELSMFIEHKGGRTPNDMRSQLLAHINRHGPPALVIVDYLQLMNGNDKYNGNRATEVGDISRRMKLLAMETGIPILALAQLNREVEGRNVKTPMLSDLRESGSIEQDADGVIFIVRTERENEMELHIAKNRQGPLGIVPVQYEAFCGRWANLESYRVPEGY